VSYGWNSNKKLLILKRD